MYILTPRSPTATACFEQALSGCDHQVCYAVKANSSLAILNLFARMGAGFDIVSGGELQRVLAAGGDAGKVVFSGVGKTAAEMRLALEAGILCFNVESEAELVRLNEVARDMGRTAAISLRVNPDVDPKTHPYISTGLKQSKFGVAYGDALALYRKAAGMPGLRITGLDCHIGSQLTEVSPFIAAAEKVLALADALAREGIVLEHLDLGGGLGIRYRDETPPSIAEYAAALKAVMQGRREKLLVEPGRALVGNAGVLLTRVEYLKHGAEKHFAIVDAAMNDLMRPALYDAYHAFQEVERARHSRAPVRSGGAGVRVRRFPGARSRPRHCTGRPAGRDVGWSVRHEHELQLQHASARRRSDGARECGHHYS